MSFFTLSRRYFYAGSDNTSCPLCARGAPNLLHLLTACSATRSLCNRVGVPMDSAFLRIFLLQHTGSELATLVDGYDTILTSLNRASLATPVITQPLAIDPNLVILDTR